MNNLKYIGIVFVAILVTGVAQAQTIKSYTIQLPELLLEGGGKVFVEPLENQGQAEAEFSDVFAKNVAYLLADNNFGAVSDAAIYNPWMTTRIYEAASSRGDANFVVRGAYNCADSVKKAFEKVESHESSGTSALPFSYYKYSASTEVAMACQVQVEKADGTAIKVYNLGDSKKDNNNSVLSPAKVTDPSSLYKPFYNTTSYKMGSALVPKLVEQRFNMKNCKIKTKDKDMKKKYNTLEKSAKAFGKSNAIKDMGKVFEEMEAIEESENLSENIGMCYELIGNLTKAKEYYTKSGDRSAIARITSMINVQETYKSLGLDVTEEEF